LEAARAASCDLARFDFAEVHDQCHAIVTVAPGEAARERANKLAKT
jgi:hypothetical protein